VTIAALTTIAEPEVAPTAREAKADPAPQMEAPAAAAPAPTETAAPAPTATAAAAPTETAAPRQQWKPADGHYLIQVGAFRSRGHAESVCGELAAKGYGTAVSKGFDKEGGVWFLCRTSLAAPYEAANATAARLKLEEHTPALLVPVRTAPDAS
jgi:cell division protein FtsN